jgi:hypothetical protein
VAQGKHAMEARFVSPETAPAAERQWRPASPAGPLADSMSKSPEDIPAATFRSWQPYWRISTEGYVKNGATGYILKWLNTRLSLT